MDKERALKNIEVIENLLQDIKVHIVSLRDGKPEREGWRKYDGKPNMELLKRNRLIIYKKLIDIENEWDRRSI